MGTVSFRFKRTDIKHLIYFFFVRLLTLGYNIISNLRAQQHLYYLLRSLRYFYP